MTRMMKTAMSATISSSPSMPRNPFDEIGGEAGGAGDPALERARKLLGDQRADLLDDHAHLARGVDRHEDLHRLAVLGRNRRRDAVQHAVDVGDVVGERLEVGELRRR